MFACFAQDLEQHNKWMKEQRELMQKTGKAVEAKQHEEVAANAKRLSEIYVGLEKFWSGRNAADAVKISQDSLAVTKTLASAAAAANWEPVPGSIDSLKKGCQGCHNAHREKLPDGKYKIKGT